MTTLEFGKIMGVSASAVSNWEAGRSAFPAEALIKISHVLCVSPAWFLGGREIGEYNEHIELLGMARCDVEGWANINKIAVKVPLPPGVDAAGGVFAVIAIGDSMEPEGIREGNLLYCDPSAPIESGDALFLKSNDGKATVKKFISMNDTYYCLHGWLDKDDRGKQKIYSYQLLKRVVVLTAPVVFVKRKA